MEILLKREMDNPDWTLGNMFIDGVLKYYTVEDEYRKDKVRGETRIPAGRYNVQFRKVESDKTKKYRARFPWFSWHLELQNVPGFQYVYIHIGNSDDDSDGCILIGTSWDIAKGLIGGSVKAFTEFYNLAARELHAGNEVWITIED